MLSLVTQIGPCLLLCLPVRPEELICPRRKMDEPLQKHSAAGGVLAPGGKSACFLCEWMRKSPFVPLARFLMFPHQCHNPCAAWTSFPGQKGVTHTHTHTRLIHGHSHTSHAVVLHAITFSVMSSVKRLACRLHLSTLTHFLTRIRGLTERPASCRSFKTGTSRSVRALYTVEGASGRFTMKNGSCINLPMSCDLCLQITWNLKWYLSSHTPTPKYICI